jgi:endonuclease/exonuclease/phosphatase family metal-dependent hydrolase
MVILSSQENARGLAAAGRLRVFLSCLAAWLLTACGMSSGDADIGADESRAEASRAESSPADDTQPAEIDRSTRSGAGARICSWNIRRLGHKFDGIAKDIAATTTVITENCDVIAVQEVMQTTAGGTPGYDALLASLGADWDGMVTKRPRPDSTSANSERYAFFFRKSAAAVCQGWTKAAQYINDDEDAFLREPAWTCLKVRAHARELLLVSYHAIYGSIAERRREVGWIDDDLDNDGTREDVVRTIRNSRPHADVVFVGDFNLTTRELHDVLPTYRDLTAGTGSTINADGAITDNLYDHVVVAPDEPLAAELAPAQVLDVRGVAHDASYFSSVSDHLPIRFVLGATAPQP